MHPSFLSPQKLIPAFRWRYYSRKPSSSVSASLAESQCPQVTIIRPITGLEPNLYECLASSFQQSYPKSKLTIYFCISSRSEPSLPILEQLLRDFPDYDAQIFVEEEDPLLVERSKALGPNPKIRNMSRAYREAKGDLVWIVDCNIWVGKGVGGRMVDRLNGWVEGGFCKPYKFVHHIPVAVDVTQSQALGEGQGLLDRPLQASSDGSPVSSGKFGARLEELFLSSSHAKFYTAINTVVIAPCIVGKSNMFRRSHLAHLTSGQGIDYFSSNICEDHLIGDLLWRGTIPCDLLPSQCQTTPEGARTEYSIGNHALCFGDLAIQPLANMSVRSYVARRIRWLRVRKFTVPAATLVEPGTESFLCSLYGAIAFVTHPWLRHTPFLGHNILDALAFWLLSITFWAAVDRTVYILLHSAQSVELDENTPLFARPPRPSTSDRSHPWWKITRRPFLEWYKAWLGREALAFPVWFWAVWGGVTVVWRERKFWVGMDMKVHEIEDRSRSQNGPDGERSSLLRESFVGGVKGSDTRAASNGSSSGHKVRQD